MASNQVPFTELLSAIVDNRGRTCPTVDNGMPLIATNCIKNDALYPVFEKIRYISKDTYENWFRSHPKPGDIIFVCKGSPGRVAMTPDPVNFCIAQDMVAVQANPEKVYPKYLFAVLRSPEIQGKIDNMHVGTLIPHFKKGDFHRLNIPIPDRRTQEITGDIYYSLSLKIELNRQINQTLEKMAAAIFKSWFIDFDPVHVKAQGQDPGLPSEIADLFPNSFEESSLGQIPTGWSVRPLTEFIAINPKRVLAKGTIAPFLEMANMPTRGPSPDIWRQREMGSGMKFINGDTLVARITPCLENGKTAYVDFLADGEVGWGSTEYIVLRPKGDIPPLFAYLLARTSDFRNFAKQQMTGSSGRQRVSADSLTKYSLIGPETNSPIFRAFGQVVSPLFRRIRASMKQSRTLTQMRDTLLPKLLSGEIELPQAEAMAEEAGQ